MSIDFAVRIFVVCSHGLQETSMDPFHLAGDGVFAVASSSVLRTGIQTLAALGGGDLLLFQVTFSRAAKNAGKEISKLGGL